MEALQMFSVTDPWNRALPITWRYVSSRRTDSSATLPSPTPSQPGLVQVSRTYMIHLNFDSVTREIKAVGFMSMSIKRSNDFFIYLRFLN